MSDADATQARRDVVADVDEILEHVINANMLSMPYDVYFELFDAVDGLGVEIENLQAENAKLRELVKRVISRYNDMNREFWGNQEPIPCDLCGMELQCIEASKHGRCLFYEYLRELGVEVDDGTE